MIKVIILDDKEQITTSQEDELEYSISQILDEMGHLKHEIEFKF